MMLQSMRSRATESDAMATGESWAVRISRSAPSTAVLRAPATSSGVIARRPSSQSGHLLFADSLGEMLPTKPEPPHAEQMGLSSIKIRIGSRSAASLPRRCVAVLRVNAWEVEDVWLSRSIGCLSSDSSKSRAERPLPPRTGFPLNWSHSIPARCADFIERSYIAQNLIYGRNACGGWLPSMTGHLENGL